MLVAMRKQQIENRSESLGAKWSIAVTVRLAHPAISRSLPKDALGFSNALGPEGGRAGRERLKTGATASREARPGQILRYAFWFSFCLTARFRLLPLDLVTFRRTEFRQRGCGENLYTFSIQSASAALEPADVCYLLWSGHELSRGCWPSEAAW